MKKFILTLALTLAFGNYAFSQSVEPDTFEKAIQQNPNAQLIDVRTTGEFGGGHLPKAQNIDFRSADFAEKIKTLDKSKPVLVYCLSGGRSAQAAELMRKEGFQVTELKGGYLKWTTKMKPLEGVPAVKHDVAWKKADFDAILQKETHVVVDFYAKWCAPCIKMMPIVDKLGGEFDGKVKVVKVEADGNQAILQAYGIDEIPGFLVFKNGKLVNRVTGFQEEPKLRALFEL
jgi:thioredoxin